MWGDECLSVIQRNAHLSAREIVNNLIAGADEFADGAEQADDITVLVLKALESEIQ
jgi:serine phosphatase RsbU (regulator of sigma subunit)